MPAENQDQTHKVLRPTQLASDDGSNAQLARIRACQHGAKIQIVQRLLGSPK